MKISELAKQLNISTDTLRYYEKQGLLTPSYRTKKGYRHYSEHNLKQVQFILRAKNIGFSLSEIKELLMIKFHQDQYACKDVKKLTLQKRDQVAYRIKELTHFYKSLSILADTCCGGQEPAQNCSILSTLEDIDELNY